MAQQREVMRWLSPREYNVHIHKIAGIYLEGFVLYPMPFNRQRASDLSGSILFEAY